MCIPTCGIISIVCNRTVIGDALANVALVIAYLAKHSRISMSDVITDKFKKNEAKYPAELVRGSSEKYSYYKDKIATHQNQHHEQSQQHQHQSEHRLHSSSTRQHDLHFHVDNSTGAGASAGVSTIQGNVANSSLHTLHESHTLHASHTVVVVGKHSAMHWKQPSIVTLGLSMGFMLLCSLAKKLT